MGPLRLLPRTRTARQSADTLRLTGSFTSTPSGIGIPGSSVRSFPAAVKQCSGQCRRSGRRLRRRDLDFGTKERLLARDRQTGTVGRPPSPPSRTSSVRRLRTPPPGNGSKNRCLPPGRSRARSVRASRPRRTTDQICGRRLMRIRPRGLTSCRHSCRRKEPLPSGQRSGRSIAPVSPVAFESWQGQFQEPQRSRNSKPVVYLGFSPR